MRKVYVAGVFLLAVLAVYLLSKQNFYSNDMISFRIGDLDLKVEVADSLAEQAQGFSGRSTLCDLCGMLFIYEKPQIQNFWMKDMKFPLDIIFIRSGKVISIAENVPQPETGKVIPKIRSADEADMVLEVNAGFAKNNKIEIGSEAKMN